MAYITINAKQNVFKQGVHYMTSPFGMRTMNGKKSMHNGVDFIGNQYACDHIVAFADGKVTSMLNTCSGKTPATGNFVVIDHGNNIQTVYYHMQKGSVPVKTGQTVKAGDVIGYMGTTGSSTGNHLHFGIKINGSWVDPIPYLKGEKTFKDAVLNKTTPPSDDGEVYIVKSGDTLSKIADKYDITYQSLAEYNNITNPNVITVGQKIIIPPMTAAQAKKIIQEVCGLENQTMTYLQAYTYADDLFLKIAKNLKR